jgi:hypothetical protein
MLAEQGTFNRLPKKLRDMLEKELETMPKVVKFKFNISNPNLDPDNYNKVSEIWPSLYNLPQTTFNYVDPETKKNIQVGIVEMVDDKGQPTKFRKIQLWARDKGELKLNLEMPDDLDKWALLELHPRNLAGKNRDKTKQGVFYRVDEIKEASTRTRERSKKKEAILVSTSFSDEEIRDFACAMNWSEHEDIAILRDKVETLAEQEVDLFCSVVNAGNMEWKATVKRAFDKQILIYHPVENKITLAQSGNTVAMLENPEKNEVEGLVDILRHGKDGAARYEVIKKLVEAQVAA